jgi:arylsulfatase A
MGVSLIRRRYVVFAASCLAALFVVSTYSGPAVGKQPNIILILSDDVGLGNIGCYGGAFKTPNLDGMAKGGTQFTYCYSTPLCGPSRCQLLTGRYPFRTGLNTNQSKDEVQPSDEVMIPTMLKSAGYATASVGKWGQICLGPGEWGFDEYLVYPGSGRFWREQTDFYTVNGKRQELPEGKYLPEIMHQFIVDFIDRHKSKPFFVYYSMSHMHGPIVHTPTSKEGADADQLYVDNNAGMDDYVGRLLKELDRQGIRDNTVVMFTGDNGTARMGVELAKVDGKPISGQKATMLEGGSRVPLIVNWPGTTPAGKVNYDLTDFTDFYTTCMELAGAKAPAGVTLDGQSFAAQLRGKNGTPRDWVYVELNGNSFVRNAKYKLNNRGELFDLSEAPFKEIPVPTDTTDAEATAAKKALQQVLDEHKALPGKKMAKNKKARRAAKMKKKGARAKKAAADA